MIVVHRGTELLCTFDVVDDDGNIVNSHTSRLQVSTLSSEDFLKALEVLKETKTATAKEFGVEEVTQEMLMDKIRDIEGQLQKLSSVKKQTSRSKKKTVPAK